MITGHELLQKKMRDDYLVVHGPGHTGVYRQAVPGCLAGVGSALSSAVVQQCAVNAAGLLAVSSLYDAEWRRPGRLTEMRVRQQAAAPTAASAQTSSRSDVELHNVTAWDPTSD